MRDDQSEDYVSALVASRICHDLISPLGAIGNGVELLTMDAGKHGTELSLITDSIARANAKIRMYRVAFGAATMDQKLSEKDIRAALIGLHKSDRQHIAWQPEGAQPRVDCKLAFLALICLQSALPFGGHLKIETTGGQWKITGRAKKFKINIDLWDGLSNRRISESLGAAEIHFVLLVSTLQANDRFCQIARTSDSLSIRF